MGASEPERIHKYGREREKVRKREIDREERERERHEAKNYIRRENK